MVSRFERGQRRCFDRNLGGLPLSAKQYDGEGVFDWPVLPVAGDICYCWTPRDDLTPGPARHPVLVCKVGRRSEKIWVFVAPGTSKKIERLYAGEFVLGQPPEGASYEDRRQEKIAFLESGLEKPTKFQLTRLIWLPYNRDFFDYAPAYSKSQNSPKMGKLDLQPAVARKFEAAKRGAGSIWTG